MYFQGEQDGFSPFGDTLFIETPKLIQGYILPTRLPYEFVPGYSESHSEEEN
jgi:hypothetical protein